MIRRVFMLFVSLLENLISGTITLLWFGLWWLADASLTVDFIGPTIESAFEGRFSTEIETAEIEWNGFRQPLTITANGVRLRDPLGQPLATIPQLRIAIDLRSLIEGGGLPRSIALNGPRLYVARDEQGQFLTGFAPAAPPRGAQEDPRPAPTANDVAVPRRPPAPPPAVPPVRLTPELVEALDDPLGDEPDSDAPPEDDPPDAGQPDEDVEGVRALLASLGQTGQSRIDRITLDDATVVFVDRRRRLTWFIPELDIALAQGDAGIVGTIQFTMPIAGENARVTGQVFYDLADDSMDVAVGLGGFIPARLSNFDPVLATLNLVPTTIDATLEARVGAGFVPISADVSVSASDVELAVPTGDVGNLQAQRVDFAAHIDFMEERLIVNRAMMDLGGAVIDGGAGMSWGGDRIELNVDATVTDLPIDRVPDYWPSNVAENARRWIDDHLHDGIVDGATIGVALSAGRSSPGDFTIEELGGGLSYTDLTVDYLPGMPPVTGVDGRGTFDATQFDLSVANAAVGSVAVPSGRVVLASLAGPEVSTADITVDVDGSVAGIMSIIDHEPLGYARLLGISPRQTAGSANGSVSFAFPLLDALATEDILVNAEAAIRGGDIGRVGGDLSLSGINAALRLDNESLNLAGGLRLAGIPFTTQFQERFSVRSGTAPRVANLAGVLDLAAFDALGLPTPPGWHGRAAATARYTAGTSVQRIELTADLAGVSFTVPGLEVTKPSNDPGTLSLIADLRPDGSASLQSVSIDTPVLSAFGRVEIGPGGEFSFAEFDRLRWPGNDLTAEIQRAGDGFAIGLSGTVIDLRQWLDPAPDPADAATVAMSGSANADVTGSTGTDLQTGGTDEATGPTIAISGRAGRLILTDDRELENAQVTLVLAGDTIRRAVIDAEAGNAPVTASYQALGDDRYDILVQANDAGGLLQALGVGEAIDGGLLRLSATQFAHASGPVIDGVLRIEGGQVVDAPLLARILAASSLTDLARRVERDGLAIDAINLPFRWIAGTVNIDDGEVISGALGLLFSGRVQPAAERIDLSGTIVPIFGLNQMLASIPVVGDILTAGEGLIAFTFAVAGNTDDPEVSVNPLAGLTPGVLRRLFFQGSGRVDGPEMSERRNRLQ